MDKKIPTLIIGIGLISLQMVYSQNKITVLTGDFKIYADDSSYKHMSRRLPDLVCSGIMYNSSLQQYLDHNPTDTAVLSQMISALDNDNPSLNSQQRKIIDSIKASYFLTGSAFFERDVFSLNIIAKNFRTSSLSYETKLKPISQFQNIIDEACLNMNRQIEMALAGDEAVRVSIYNFKVSFLKNAYAKPSDNIYAPDYYTVLISQNLKSSDSAYYVIRPHPYYGEAIKPIYTSKIGDREIGISGTVTFSKDSFQVQPIIYGEHLDSVYLATFSGLTGNKKVLNASLLEYIQSYLDATIQSKHSSASQLILSGGTAFDYKKEFAISYQQHKLKLALFYATELLRKFAKEQESGNLFKALVFYDQGKNPQALECIETVQKLNPQSKEAFFLKGLTYLKMGRYWEAANLLNKLDDSTYGKREIHYYAGQCFYYLDSIQRAKSEFHKQISYSAGPIAECYYFLGKIAEKEKDTQEAEINYLKAKELDSTNTVYLQSLESLFEQHLFDFIMDTISSGIAVDQRIIKGIKENLINENSLLKMNYLIQLLIGADTSHSLRTQIQRVISIFNEYKYLKNGLSDRNYESEALLYLRLGNVDSTLANFRQIIHSTIYQKDKGLVYLDIGELYILKNEFNRADSVLIYIEENIHSDSLANYDKETAILLSFYQLELKIIEGKNTQSAELVFNQNMNSLTSKDVFMDWSLSDLSNWIKSRQFDNAVKNLLLNNLCIMSKHTSDNIICN